jgi:hypothetical protein
VTPRAGLVCVVLALPLAGCGGASLKTAPVSGRVMLDGRPLAQATVTFVPVAGAGDKEPLPSSVGTTGEGGRYSLVLNSGGKTNGAVLGKHTVVIILGAQGGAAADARPTFHKQLPQRYNRKTELKCEVPPGGRDDADFDLKSK